jgi:hypothetical protein
VRGVVGDGFVLLRVRACVRDCVTALSLGLLYFHSAGVDAQSFCAILGGYDLLHEYVLER